MYITFKSTINITIKSTKCIIYWISIIIINNIIISILEDIKDYKIKRRELKDSNRKLGTFLITNCSGCREEYELFKNSICLDSEGNPI